MTELNDDEEWDKAVGQFRLTIGKLLQPLRKYGQADYIDNYLVKEIESLGIQLHHKLSGLDEPYHINEIHWQ